MFAGTPNSKSVPPFSFCTCPNRAPPGTRRAKAASRAPSKAARVVSALPPGFLPRARINQLGSTCSPHPSDANCSGDVAGSQTGRLYNTAGPARWPLPPRNGGCGGGSKAARAHGVLARVFTARRRRGGASRASPRRRRTRAQGLPGVTRRSAAARHAFRHAMVQPSALSSSKQARLRKAARRRLRCAA